jgi:hypothetical protein
MMILLTLSKYFHITFFEKNLKKNFFLKTNMDDIKVKGHQKHLEWRMNVLSLRKVYSWSMINSIPKRLKAIVQKQGQRITKFDY